MASTPPNYETFHKQIHQWMLTGDADVTVDQSTGLNAMTVTSIAELLEDYQALPSPYEDHAPYNSEDDTVRPRSVLDFIEDQVGTIGEKIDPEVAYSRYVNAINDSVEDVFDSSKIDAAVSSFEDKLEDKTEEQIAQLNAKYSDANMVNSSNRAVAIAVIERGKGRDLADYRAKLELQQEQSEFDIIAKGAFQLMQTDGTSIQARANLAQVYLQAVTSHIADRRQYAAELLDYDLQDALWDFRLHDYVGQGLKAISGSKIVPGSPNPALEWANAVLGGGSVMSSMGGNFLNLIGTAFGLGLF